MFAHVPHVPWCVRKIAMFAKNFALMEAVFFFFTFVIWVKASQNQPNGLVERSRKSQTSLFQKAKTYTNASSLALELLEHGSRNICKGCLAKACPATVWSIYWTIWSFSWAMNVFRGSTTSAIIFEQLCQSENKISHKLIDMTLNQRRFNTQTENVNVELRKFIT